MVISANLQKKKYALCLTFPSKGFYSFTVDVLCEMNDISYQFGHSLLVSIAILGCQKILLIEKKYRNQVPYVYQEVSVIVRNVYMRVSAKT